MSVVQMLKKRALFNSFPPSMMPFAFLTFFLLSLLSSSSSSSLCPPFNTSHPPFPFSSSPGFGHPNPAFHINCSTPHSIITVNNLSFSLLTFHPNSSTLHLSPRQTHVSNFTNCSSSLHSLNFSRSPFQISLSSCYHLSLLHACHCSSLHFLRDCVIWEKHRHVPPHRCKKDLIDGFLRNGIEVEYNTSRDSYFLNCQHCDGVCGYNQTDPNKQFICFESKSNVFAVTFTTFLVVFLLIAVTVGGVAIFRWRHKEDESEEDPAILFLRRHQSASLLLPPVFTYEELEASTNKFDPNRKLGDGGFGSVYLGHLNNGRIVAVKYLHNNNKNGKLFLIKSFCNEILILSSINHPNLVKLHGYCSDTRGLILVYDYVANGTLWDHLHNPTKKFNRIFKWQVRLEIAIEIALAIDYLHRSVKPPIVHRDITSSNIFVEKDMRVKVGDFGLSRLLASPSSSSYVWTGPQGTPGYLDPDYYRSFRLTEKSDIYSFGVVLFELISGLKAVDPNRDKRYIGLTDLVLSKIQMGLLHEVVDPNLVVDGKDDAMDEVYAVAELAFRCVAVEKDDRPNSKEVVEQLKGIQRRSRVGRDDMI